MAYTKGEWRPLYSHVDPTSGKEIWYIGAAGKEGIANKIYSRANAHLIAAAPKLAELLFESRQCIDNNWRERRDKILKKAGLL